MSQTEEIPKSKRFRSDKAVKTGVERKDSKEYDKDQQPKNNSKFTFKMNGKSATGKLQGTMKKKGGALQNKSSKSKNSSVQRKSKRK